MLPLTSSASCLANVSAPAAPDIESDETPIGVGEFDALIAHGCPLSGDAPIAVAVSGGGDSMALALLADAWAHQKGRQLHAVTVDHRLRPGSADEAVRVEAWLAARGIRHHVLAWTDDKPTAGLQAAARAARYRLIGAWAARLGIRDVLLAHQLEDQAETFLMRLARGSGIAGLAAMRSVVASDGIRLCRPLLPVPRARLRAVLRDAGQDWIEDPSNDSSKFARTGYRRLVAKLAARGVAPTRLAGLTDDFARLDALMQAAGRRFLGGVAIWARDGSVVLDRSAFAALPEAVASVVLRQILSDISGRALAPRGDRLARAMGRLADLSDSAAFTLGYCRFVARGPQIRVSPEAGRTVRTGNPGVSGSFPAFCDEL